MNSEQIKSIIDAKKLLEYGKSSIAAIATSLDSMQFSQMQRRRLDTAHALVVSAIEELDHLIPDLHQSPHPPTEAGQSQRASETIQTPPSGGPTGGELSAP